MRFLRCMGLAVLTAATTARCQSVKNHSAPTASGLTPEQKNAQWVAASAKFTPQRERWLRRNAETIAAGPFRDDWQSLAAKQTPAWFNDAKFGIFLHWGVFSVAANGSEWYSRNMYEQGSEEFQHHVATFGAQSVFGYKDLVPKFTMANFNPAEWAALFRDAGARYVVPVAEHHDGFAEYDSDLTDWNAVRMGPKRDIYGDLAAALRKDGIYVGASYHRAEHDWFFDGGRTFASDVNDPKYAAFYGPAETHEEIGGNDDVLIKDFTFVSEQFREDWQARATELVERYHPDLIYFDWWVGQPDFRASERRFAAYFYNQAARRGQPVVMFQKNGDMTPHSAVADVERGEFEGIQAEPWQTDTSISTKSWGYIENDDYKPAGVLVHQLIDIVSKNGNLLLNVGPRADGTIPPQAQSILRSIGAWLRINGEAIYGTRPWTRFGEGPTKISGGTFQDNHEEAYSAKDFRFTTHDGVLYAIAMGWPEPERGVRRAVIQSLGGGSGHRVRDVTLLGFHGKLAWKQTAAGLEISLPDSPPGEFAYSYRIVLEPTP